MVIIPIELVGLRIRITRAPNSTLEGIEGVIVDETKNTLVVKKGESTITILKPGIQFTIIDTGKVVHGEDIMRRPEERLKGR